MYIYIILILSQKSIYICCICTCYLNVFIHDAVHNSGRVIGNRCTGLATDFFVVWGSKFSLQGILATVVRRSLLATVVWGSAHQHSV
jgi:hypothetical protein